MKHFPSMLSHNGVLRFEALPAPPYYAGLVLSGIATVLLGPILPVVSAQWGLTDAQAGSLFTAQFTGSIFGAILSSYHRRRCVVGGYAAIAAGLAALALANYRAGLIGMFLIGAGVGAAVTATNLIFGNEYPEIRGRLLARTNFFWGVGAVTAPQLVAMTERHHALQLFLLVLAAATFLICLRFVPLIKASTAAHYEDIPIETERGNLRILVLFSMMLFLYVGCETTIAGWIATYMHRVESFSIARSSEIVSFFWLAIVAGRAISPLLLRAFLELPVLLSSIGLALAGLSFLLTRHSVSITLAAVVVTGLGCASIFPLITSRLLGRVGRSRRTGWVFAICGSGGAVIPWLTGFLSQHTGSLSTAFSVPLLGLAAIILCVLVESIGSSRG